MFGFVFELFKLVAKKTDQTATTAVIDSFNAYNNKIGNGEPVTTPPKPPPSTSRPSLAAPSSTNNNQPTQSASVNSFNYFPRS
jgi:hypothetical protein